MIPSVYAPIKAVYAAYRTELMNRKYYGRRLAATKRLAQVMDITVAVGTSTAIGTWALWRTGGGHHVWEILSAFAAIVAVIKPFLQLPSHADRYGRLFAGHGTVFYDLRALVQEIDRVRDYPQSVHAAYAAVCDRAKALSIDDDPTPKGRILRRCFREVKQEIPESGLWWPPRGEPNA